MQKRNCRSIRLPGYDYSQSGWYFITICTYKHSIIFGDIVDGIMVLNSAGEYVNSCWMDIPNHFPHVKLDEYVIMPNHVHGIINICGDNAGTKNVGAKKFSPLPGETSFKSPSKTIGPIVRGYKTGVTKWMRNNIEIYQVRQRNYWEHIIRNELELNHIRLYIIDNPLKWDDDKYYKNQPS